MHDEIVPFGRINVFVIYTASTLSIVHHNPDDLNLEDVNNYMENAIAAANLFNKTKPTDRPTRPCCRPLFHPHQHFNRAIEQQVNQSDLEGRL
jgi:hypothetical protein